MLLGESCGEPSSVPCYVISFLFPGTELGSLKCFVEIESFTAVSILPPTAFHERKYMTLCQGRCFRCMDHSRFAFSQVRAEVKLEIGSVAGL